MISHIDIISKDGKEILSKEHFPTISKQYLGLPNSPKNRNLLKIELENKFSCVLEDITSEKNIEYNIVTFEK